MRKGKHLTHFKGQRKFSLLFDWCGMVLTLFKLLACLPLKVLLEKNPEFGVF